MNTIKEPARDIKVINDVDIVVLGGSCTGVFAAVRAARLGARVAIVEQAGAFGKILIGDGGSMDISNAYLDIMIDDISAVSGTR